MFDGVGPIALPLGAPFNNSTTSQIVSNIWTVAGLTSGNGAVLLIRSGAAIAHDARL